MHIKPFDKDIKNIFESGFYIIPRFQRPYSWDEENITEFWEDTIESDDDEYFIGSMVTYRDKKNPDEHYIVDGQQRLTTIILVLSAIRDTLHYNGYFDGSQGLQKIIERADIDNKDRFVLDSETSSPFFQKAILSYASTEDDVYPEWEKEEEEAIISAHQYFATTLVEIVEEIKFGQYKNKKSKILKRLQEIRDKILRLKAVIIELDNEDDAYHIFETLNTRGKELGVGDLVKNLLTRLSKPKNKQLDEIKLKWEKILTNFDTASEEIDVNTFLLHQWLSREEYVAKAKLFKSIKRKIGKSKVTKYADQLVNDSDIYRAIISPDDKKWPKEHTDVRSSLKAISNLFRLRQPLPLVMCIMSELEAKKISLLYAKKALTTIEYFHFQFTAITSQRAGGGVALMYSRDARELIKAKDRHQKHKYIDQIISNLREKIPTYDVFRGNFVELRYTNKYPRDKNLVRYILEKTDAYYRTKKSTIPDYSNWSIEHIEPQSSKNMSDDLIGHIGNLILVPEDLNEKLGTKSFSEKKKMLIEAEIPIDPTIKKSSKWGESAVRARADEIAKISHHDIWSF